jgi:CRP-like cAMP-binding protein
MSTAYVDFLGRVPLFRHIEPHHLAQLAAKVQERRYDPGAMIIEQAMPGTGLFLLMQGRCVVRHYTMGGGRTEVDILEPFDFFGELSLLDDSPTSAAVVADAPTKCLFLDKQDFWRELTSSPEMAIGMLREIANRHRRLLSKQ